MRKQYQWFVLILFAGVFCCTNQDNNLKACGTNATACTVVKEKVVNTVRPVRHLNKIEVDYAGSEENASLYMFTDPFLHNN